MLVLGIETTCDETAVAVVRDGQEILSNVIATQEDLQAIYGGVVPELACRRHCEVLLPLVKKALGEKKLSAIDLIAVARGPGLIGALLIGLNFAKALAFSTGIPFVGVNHVEAHLYAAMMGEKPPFPALGIVLSGGHTSLLLIEKLGSYRSIGSTQDDALGEAFDKTAALLGLPYPGGPQIEKWALKGDITRYPFKPGRIKKAPYDFSFSGLKTAVLYAVKGQNGTKRGPTLLSTQEKCDVAASFQHAAFTDVVKKAIHASQKFGARCMVLGGGVTCNRYLRSLLSTATDLPLFWPKEGLSLDNGAMIAGLGYHKYQAQGADPLDLEPQTRIPLGVENEKAHTLCSAHS
ncbi:MAG: tRNA (adenosine(37)-N6)-threonylcarbamoyltransferase complex transferase subunit TsaD [Chlamydiales bacterium]